MTTGADRAGLPGRSRWVALFVAGLLAATVAFVVGVSLERNAAPAESSTQTSPHSEVGESGNEAGGETGGETTGETGSPSQPSQPSSESGEAILGVNPESIPFVVLAALVALLLAAAAWWRPLRIVFIVGALFCLAALTLDIREVTHQLNENRNGIAAVAGLVALLHLLAGAAAGMAARSNDSGANPTPDKPRTA